MRTHAGLHVTALECFFPRASSAGSVPFSRWTSIVGDHLIFAGSIRRDLSIPNGIAYWVVGDNLRKGAALNVHQIAELMISRGKIRQLSRSRSVIAANVSSVPK